MEGGSNSLHGGIRGIPLQPVGDYDKGLRALIAVPIKIEKIPVRGLDAFPLAVDRCNPAEKYGQDCLKMPIRQSLWRSVDGGCNQGHGEIVAVALHADPRFSSRKERFRIQLAFVMALTSVPEQHTHFPNHP